MQSDPRNIACGCKLGQTMQFYYWPQALIRLIAKKRGRRVGRRPIPFSGIGVRLLRQTLCYPRPFFAVSTLSYFRANSTVASAYFVHSARSP